MENACCSTTITYAVVVIADSCIFAIYGNIRASRYCRRIERYNEVGVPTPTFDVMYAALKPYTNGAPA